MQMHQKRENTVAYIQDATLTTKRACLFFFFLKLFNCLQRAKYIFCYTNQRTGRASARHVLDINAQSVAKVS